MINYQDILMSMRIWKNNKKTRFIKMRIHPIINQKGGVGKTTTAINLGAALNSFGKEVIVVDDGSNAVTKAVLKKIAEVVNLPVSFFYAEKDIEAELLLRFHRMSEEDKKKVLEFVEHLK